MKKINKFRIWKNTIENWFPVTINILLKKGIECKIKNIGSAYLKEGNDYLNNSLFIALISTGSDKLNKDQYDNLKTYLTQLDNEVITVKNLEDGKEFKFLNKEIPLILETFLYGDYAEIPYTSKEASLIDIGANVGDTAIYFANKGYDVIALEPIPHIYNLALKNIGLNPTIKEKITFINKACSCKKGHTIINFDENKTADAGEYSKATKQIKVETMTLNNIINEYDIKPNILKIDCEGCEVNIIKHSDLSMFNQIIMEYHTAFTGINENILIDILKDQGFDLKSQVKFKNEGIGIIYMVNKQN